MYDVALIFPHQLFKHHPALHQNRQVYLIEEWLYFRQYNFHRQKLILHRAGMKCYEAFLQQSGAVVEYIETMDERSEVANLIAHLHAREVTSIHLVDVVDNWLMNRIKTACNKYAITVTIYPTPTFLNTLEDVADFFSKKETFLQADFYMQQRRKRKILMEPNGKPTGRRWTYDADNRKKFPKKEVVPRIEFPKENTFLREARVYVQQQFPNNYGNAEAPHYFVTSFDEAENWLQQFLKNRFEKFGVYEDAIVAKEHVLHHSVLTPMLNTGLLTPQQVVEAAVEYADEHGTPINSVEGFIRQIIGWREFIRIVYELKGSRQRTGNFWDFKRKIPASFWKGETGIVPIDLTIKKVLRTGYCHHIERLMVLGNFMLLCEFDPDEVYKWFMELFIDAYDWVMVPNVYGMTQFADGGIMATKPYISGSSYLMKMSDYEKGEWQQVWDGLFWRFMHVHRDFFLQNPRLGMLVVTFDKMSEEKRNSHLANAEKYLSSL